MGTMIDKDDEINDGMVNEEDLSSIPDYAVQAFEEFSREAGNVKVSVHRKNELNPSGNPTFMFASTLTDVGGPLELQQKIQQQCGAGNYLVLIRTRDGKIKRRYSMSIGELKKPETKNDAQNGNQIQLDFLKGFLDEQSRITRELLSNMSSRSAQTGPDPVQLITVIMSAVASMVGAIRNQPTPQVSVTDPMEMFERMLLIADKMNERALPPPDPQPGDWIGNMIDKIAPAFGSLLELEREKTAVARLTAESQAAQPVRAHETQPQMAQPHEQSGMIRPSIRTISSEQIMASYRTILERHKPNFDMLLELGKIKADPDSVAKKIDDGLASLGIGDDDVMVILQRPDAMSLLLNVWPDGRQIEPWLERVRLSLIALIEGAIDSDKPSGGEMFGL